MTKTLLGILTVMFAVPAAPALAQQPAAQVAEKGEEEPALTAIRANGIVQGFDFAGVGVELGRRLDDHFGVEVSVDGVDLQRGYKGEYGQVLWRSGFTAGRHNINLGVGPGVLRSVDFGYVAFLVSELDYEYRLPGGLSLAVGLGMPVALNDSKEVPCEYSGLLACFLENTRFKAGQFMPRARVALGYSF
jgi:hypothetical protein